MLAYYISAAHKSSGKTALATGLCAAFAARGLVVQPFKKGPDYIDPMWLSAAAGRACYNLDFNTMDGDELHDTFARASNAEIAIVEGTKGLHDGVANDGSDSNAAMAKLLGLPVILNVDCRGMTRGIAPLLLGMQQFDENVLISGVVLNRVGGDRHQQKLVTAVETYTDLAVLGALPNDECLALEERHLGLITVTESAQAARHVDRLREAVEAAIDLEALAGNTNVIATSGRRLPGRQTPAVRIGVLRDSAFGFYYADDLEALQQHGAELVFIDALSHARLPPVDGLFIGGGFPETHLRRLHANAALRAEIADAAERGLPIYAECGGLMYLARSLTWRDASCQMVGALPLDCVMHDRPQGRGYVTLATTGVSLWPVARPDSQTIQAHEFHYSAVENVSPRVQYAYRVVRGHGLDGDNDGIVYRNVLASYAHLRHTRQSPWVTGFLDFVAAGTDQETRWRN